MTNARIKIVYVVCVVATLVMLPLAQTAFGAQPMLQKPHLTKAGKTYLQPKNSSWVVKMHAPVKGASIHYTLDGSIPTTQSAAYSKPIPVKTANGVMTVRAILTKGERKSAVITREYTPWLAEGDGFMGNARKILPQRLCRGQKKIKGKVELKPYVNEGKFLPYINVTVKSKGKKASKYSAKIKGNQWQISLKRSLKKGDRVTFSVTTKNEEVCFVNANVGRVGIYSYSPGWYGTSRRVK